MPVSNPGAVVPQAAATLPEARVAPVEVANDAPAEPEREPVEADAWVENVYEVKRGVHVALYDFLRAKLIYTPRLKNGVLDASVVKYAHSQAMVFCRDHPEWLPRNRYEVVLNTITAAIGNVGSEVQELRRLLESSVEMTTHRNALLVESAEHRWSYKVAYPWWSKNWRMPTRTTVRGRDAHPLNHTEENPHGGVAWTRVISVAVCILIVLGMLVYELSRLPIDWSALFFTAMPYVARGAANLARYPALVSALIVFGAAVTLYNALGFAQ